MKKRKPEPAETIPASHLEAIDAAGFTVLSYQDVAIEVRTSTGDVRKEWLPRHLVNWQTHGFVEFRRGGDGNYDFDGWESAIDHTNGGRYRTVAQALAWFEWLKRQNGGFRSP